MSTATDCSFPFSTLEIIHNKDNVNAKEDKICLNQMTNVKPLQSTSSATTTEMDDELCPTDVKSTSIENLHFTPVFLSGSCAEKGSKLFMEDEHICIDNLHQHLGTSIDYPSPGAFYGVFDGHGGTEAAVFVRRNILKFIVEGSDFHVCLEKAIKNAFIKADYAFADDSSVDISSGTTVLTALILGRRLVVANAGDCRAVLSKRGKAIDLSNDHKPNCPTERLRIEQLGGVVHFGYLNGQLSVSRAIGDWHMKGHRGSLSPLSPEPEIKETFLTEEDEFLILGCDGLWDVMSSQEAVTMSRKELMLHNDPERCAKQLVREALKKNACDNLTVVVVCFSDDFPSISQSRDCKTLFSGGLGFLKVS
ncbi:probable protein phosphatase 2C 27 [Impatiens glandulifera]|uniref:probable protein phosphatase 2C 27 n=1 Tax=Impatiens glandulifera TaxID=253017 RepID=UPI001FB100F4|nr:probable protein phosphatase 2C 27 [Impatiens glandulifera]XP_047324032.1 probable protein phosphatase 2C 27 [Impatiens glandulifera]